MYKFEKHILVLYNSFKLLQKHNFFKKKNSNVFVLNSGNTNNLKIINFFINIMFLHQLSGKKIEFLKARKSISNFKTFKNDLIFLKSTLRKNYFYNFLKILHFNNIFIKKNKKTINIGLSNLLSFKKILTLYLNTLHISNNFGSNLNILNINYNINKLYKIFL